MAAPSSSASAATPIHQAGHNEFVFAADPIYSPAVAASAGMYGATGALPTHVGVEDLMAPPPLQGAAVVMEMVQPQQGVPVMAWQPPLAEAMMGPSMTATQLLQAVEMVARLPFPISTHPVEHQSPDYFAMAAPSSSASAATPIQQAGHNEFVFAADPIYPAAVAASAGMYGATGALPTHVGVEDLMALPLLQGAAVVMEMVQPPQGVPVMAWQPPLAEAMMGPPMTATQLLQAVEMVAQLTFPIATPPVEHQSPHYFDMPSGQQMTGFEQEMAGFDESIGLPYGPYIYNGMPSVDSYEGSLPSNASNTIYVEGLPSNCTRRELTHLFRPFTGFYDVRLVNGGFDNSHVIALVEFNTPVQAFSAMESLQGYLFDIHDLHSHSLNLQFCPPGLRSDDGPRHGR